MLQARFAEHSPKVWVCGDVATVHVFGGHYFIKKRKPATTGDVPNPFNDCGALVLAYVATLAEI